MTRPVILVVDDVEEVRLATRTALSTKYDVVEASSAERARVMLASGEVKPNLIILDVLLPDGDGYELCREFKGVPSLENIPVIFISSLDDSADESYGLTCGGNDFIVKPLHPAVLNARVQTHLRAAQVAELLRITAQSNAREAAQVAELSSMRRRLLAIASHNLRQPVHAMGLILHELISGELPPSITDKLTIAASINREIGDSLHLLLSQSQLELGAIEPHFEVANVSEIVQRLHGEFKLSANAKGLSLRTDLPTNPTYAFTDGGVLSGALQNLLSNAIRYTDNGHVTLRVRCSEGEVCIDVCDTGPGITDEELDSKSISQKSRSRGGTGLGISISRELSRIACAQLSFTAQHGHGTVATLRLESASHDLVQEALSCVQIQAPKVDASSAYAMLGKRAKILLIEDDSKIAKFTHDILVNGGFEVIASDLFAATPIGTADVNLSNISLILADYNLGGEKTGADIILEIRRASGAQTAAVLLTGDVSPNVQRAAEEHGITLAYKPIQPEKLLNLLRGLTQK